MWRACVRVAQGRLPVCAPHSVEMGCVTSAMSQPRPPGWYHLDAHRIRYWNGDRWVGDPSAVPQGVGRLLPPGRPPKRRNWWGIALLVVVGLSVLGGIVEGLERRTSDLGDGREGTQQEWIDYFDSADASVATLNRQISGSATTASIAQAVAALERLSDSPDEALNRSVSAAIEACGSDDVLRCAQALDRVADAYNAALRSAEEQGLVDVKDD